MSSQPPPPAPQGPDTAAPGEETPTAPSSAPPSHIVLGPYDGPRSTHAAAAFAARAPSGAGADARWNALAIVLGAIGLVLAMVAVFLFVTR